MFIDAPVDSLKIHAPVERPPAQVVARFAGIGVATIGDVFDRMLVVDGAIAPVVPTDFVGTALTVLTRGGDNLAVHRAVDEARPGDVLVINGQGDTSRAIVGDLLVTAMLAQGVAGVVVDGAVRDKAVLNRLGLPVFARAVTPAGPFKTGPGMIGAPVAIGGVVFHPGDIVVGDADGVALVPAAEADAALERLEEILRVEESMRRRISHTST